MHHVAWALSPIEPPNAPLDNLVDWPKRPTYRPAPINHLANGPQRLRSVRLWPRKNQNRRLLSPRRNPKQNLPNRKRASVNLRFRITPTSNVFNARWRRQVSAAVETAKKSSWPVESKWTVKSLVDWEPKSTSQRRPSPLMPSTSAPKHFSISSSTNHRALSPPATTLQAVCGSLT